MYRGGARTTPAVCDHLATLISHLSIIFFFSFTLQTLTIKDLIGARWQANPGNSMLNMELKTTGQLFYCFYAPSCSHIAWISMGICRMKNLGIDLLQGESGKLLRQSQQSKIKSSGHQPVNLDPFRGIEWPFTGVPISDILHMGQLHYDSQQ